LSFVRKARANFTISLSVTQRICFSIFVTVFAIRKNHKTVEGVRRGDLFDLVLIQIKGGGAVDPSKDDIARLHAVAEHHQAKEVVLVGWKKSESLEMRRLVKDEWIPVNPSTIFGT
jgi:hypothetical protein